MEPPIIRSRVHAQKKLRQGLAPDTPVLVLAEQSRDAIRRRRTIRETFHDSKAVTVKMKTR
jgi:hypothetical protein